MAQHEEIIVWLDRRWKEAIEHHLKDETLQEHLENVLDELCNQLPEREYARINREIWEEDRMAREKAEAARTYSAYRVVEGGEEHYFRMTPGEELLGAVMPEVGVVSVGSNSYGHPTRDALLRLTDVGVTVYRTDLQGNIYITVN